MDVQRLSELPRASLLTRPQNHGLSYLNNNYVKEIATLHHQNTDNPQDVQNRYFNFTKEIATLRYKNDDSS